MAVGRRVLGITALLGSVLSWVLYAAPTLIESVPPWAPAAVGLLLALAGMALPPTLGGGRPCFRRTETAADRGGSCDSGALILNLAVFGIDLVSFWLVLTLFMDLSMGLKCVGGTVLVALAVALVWALVRLDRNSAQPRNGA